MSVFAFISLPVLSLELWNLKRFAPYKGIRIPELLALERGIQIMESGISLLIGIRNPSFKDEESGIQYVESGIQGVESRIQDCLGFPYLGRKVSSTDSCHLFLSNVSVFGL